MINSLRITYIVRVLTVDQLFIVDKCCGQNFLY